MRRTKAFRRLVAAMLAVTLLMSVCAPAALASVKAKVISSTRVYRVPSRSAKSVRIPKGLKLTVTSASGGWARVKYKGKTAYIPVAYLNLVSRLTAYTKKSTPVYRQPVSSSSRMGTLSIGTAVYVVGKAGSYYRVENNSGSVSGYVKGGCLTSKAKITAAYNAYKKAKAKKTVKKSSGSSKAARLKSLLNSLCGRRYANSANPPSTFNCSALVRYVMGRFGISMKGTAAEQANDSRYTKITSASKLKVGDILCFDEDNNRVCDHTGIYIGGGKMVDASRDAGRVKQTSLNSWYRAHFMWARRPK